MRTSVTVFPHHVLKFTIQVAVHTLGRQEEMEMVLTSRGDLTDPEKQWQ